MVRTSKIRGRKQAQTVEKYKSLSGVVHECVSKLNHGPCAQSTSGENCFALNHVQLNLSNRITTEKNSFQEREKEEGLQKLDSEF